MKKKISEIIEILNKANEDKYRVNHTKKRIVTKKYKDGEAKSSITHNKLIIEWDAYTMHCKPITIKVRDD